MSSSFDISNITTKSLDEFRLVTDPLADNAIASIITSGFEKEINKILMTMVRNDSFSEETFSDLPPEINSILNNYIESTNNLPEWADDSLIKTGEKVFETYGPEIFMLLNVSSLPLCYSCAKGAQVLYDTGRLLSHNKDIDPLARRLMETAQMVVNVLSPGGIAPKGRGLITIQKVRLIHASIRYYLKNGQYNDTPWDVAKYGEPINQEDLAGTLMSFAPVILSGLKHLNVELSLEETNAYMHCWKVVGHLMGIDAKLLPETYEEAFELATKILIHQSAESEAGKALTASCIGFINYIIPGNAFDDLPAYLMSFFLQDFSESSKKDLSKCIGLNSNASDVKDKVLLSITKYIIGEVSHLEGAEFVRKATLPFNRFLLQGIINHFNGGKGVQFFIPPSLQKNWGLTDEWSDYKTLSPNLFGNRLEWQKKTETIK